MPEGEWAFLETKGPRTKLALRITVDANTALRLAAAELGMSKTGYATWLLELWADEWLKSLAEEVPSA
jgi:hypothetical protein